MRTFMVVRRVGTGAQDCYAHIICGIFTDEQAARRLEAEKVSQGHFVAVLEFRLDEAIEVDLDRGSYSDEDD